MIWIALAIVFIAGVILHFAPDNKESETIGALKHQLEQSRNFGLEFEQRYTDLTRDYEKLQHQKKSSEVKTGHTIEQLLPFLDDFPYPDDEIKGMFQPIDLIVFRDSEIVFIEIKSGDAQLSDKQRKIRDLINEKKVRFETHRVNGKGYKIK